MKKTLHMNCQYFFDRLFNSIRYNFNFLPKKIEMWKIYRICKVPGRLAPLLLTESCLLKKRNPNKLKFSDGIVLILYEWWATCESPSNHDLTSAASQEWWEGDSKICNASRVRSEATSRVINCRFVRSRIMSTGFSNPSTFCRQDYHSCCFKSDLFSKGVFWWLKLLRYTKST